MGNVKEMRRREMSVVGDGGGELRISWFSLSFPVVSFRFCYPYCTTANATNAPEVTVCFGNL